MQMHVLVYIYLSAYAPNERIAKSQLIEDTDFQVRLKPFPQREPPILLETNTGCP